MYREMLAMDNDLQEIYPNSTCKRLQDERDELREELSKECALSMHLAGVSERLRAERDEARVHLAEHFILPGIRKSFL